MRIPWPENMLAIVALSGMGAALLAGCSGQKKHGDDWYEYSASVEAREKEWIRNQTSVGVDPVEAAHSWGLNYSIEQTWGRDHVTVLEGNDLRGTAAGGDLAPPPSQNQTITP